jgi:hypothetical protein
LFVTVIGEVASTNLTPASRRQDHTTSPSAEKRPRQKRYQRPPHPVPNVRDDRETPLKRDGMRESIKLFLPSDETKYFCRRDWTPKSPDSPTGKSGDVAVATSAQRHAGSEDMTAGYRFVHPGCTRFRSAS